MDSFAEFYKAALNSYPGCILLAKLDGTIIFANLGCASLLGIEPAAWEGTNMRDYDTDLDIHSLYQRAITDGYVEVQRESHNHKGQSASIRIVAFAVKKDPCTPIGVCLTIRRFGTDFIYDSFNQSLKIKEVAAIVRVSRQTVHEWIKDGSLPATKIGKTVRISRFDFEKFRTDKYT